MQPIYIGIYGDNGDDIKAYMCCHILCYDIYVQCTAVAYNMKQMFLKYNNYIFILGLYLFLHQYAIFN